MVFEVAFDRELLGTAGPHARERLVAVVHLLEVLVEVTAGHKSLVAALMKTLEDVGVDVCIMVLLEIAAAREALVAARPVARVGLAPGVSAGPAVNTVKHLRLLYLQLWFSRSSRSLNIKI